MAKTQATCIECKEVYTLNRAEQALYEDGYLSLENYLCDNCAIDSGCTQSEFKEYSDADNEL